jgi:hypothetical protein
MIARLCDMASLATAAAVSSWRHVRILRAGNETSPLCQPISWNIWVNAHGASAIDGARAPTDRITNDAPSRAKRLVVFS